MKPRAFFIIITILCFLSISCGPAIFGKKSAHEKYAERLKDAHLDESAVGTAWFHAAGRSLDRPISIHIPFKETGFFPAETPSAVGYQFNLKRGENINVQVTTVPVSGFLIFIELWNADKKLVESADTLTKRLQYEADRDGTYNLRIQPELLQSVEYTVTISTSPSLAFPVRDSDNPRIMSFWGADRDAGSRSHEGIDIFAARRTPALAVANGRITRVDENNLGGKVIFMRPEGKNYSIYYAHLDSQFVKAGQQVHAGDIIGLIGNSGNARTTSPHLHFGIYTSGGAVDPLPFVNKNRPAPKEIIASLKNLNKQLRTEKGQVVTVIGAVESTYHIQFPDGSESFVPGSDLSIKPLRKLKLKEKTRLLDRPYPASPAKMLISSGEEVSLLGTHNSLYYINYKDQSGWIIPIP